MLLGGDDVGLKARLSVTWKGRRQGGDPLGMSLCLHRASFNDPLIVARSSFKIARFGDSANVTFKVARRDL